MTETSRTTVTLTKYYMNKVDRLVGTFSTTKAQVMSKIIENFIDSNEFILLIRQITENQEEISEKQKYEESKRPEIIEKRINSILKAANKIPLDSFLKHLNIDENYFYENNRSWSIKFSYILEDNKIIKMK